MLSQNNSSENLPMSMQEIHTSLLDILACVINLCQQAQIEYCLIGGGCLGIVRHHNCFVPWDDDLDIAIWAKDIPRFLEVMASLPSPYQVIPRKWPSLNPGVMIVDTSTKLQGNAHGGDNLGIFVDVIPMMIWPCNLWKRLDNLLSLFCLNIPSIDQIFWLPYIKKIIYRLKIHKLLIPFQKKIFHPMMLMLEKLCYENKTGIISGATGKIWIGKYPWKTIFPLQEQELQGLKIKVPNDLNNFLILRYGKNYMTILPESERWNHFEKAYRRI